MRRVKASLVAVAAVAVVALVVTTTRSTPPRNSGNGPRLSPASLDLDTCSCPTTFGDPTCESRTSWTLEKVSNTADLLDPAGEPFSFTVTVTEGETKDILTGVGQIVLTNSGEQTPSLSSVVVSLEKKHTGGPNPCRAPGPSGNAWTVIGTAVENEFAACGGTAATCRGDLPDACNDNVGNLVLFCCDDTPLFGNPGACEGPNPNDIIALSDQVQVPPTLDNDGDGVRDEDPALADPLPNPNANACDVHDNDGDGSYDEDPTDGIDNDGDGQVDEDGPDDDEDGFVDEDGACEDAVIFCFEYEFDVTGLDIAGNGIAGDNIGDLRIDLLVTFNSGGRRGGTCSADVNCDGDDDSHVRTIQQRHVFDLGPQPCTPVCDCVQLTDDGAFSLDDACVTVDSTTTLDEEICATGVEGTQTVRSVEGTVSCASGDCSTVITNTATLACDDQSLIEGSPDSASFNVECGAAPPGGGPDLGDFCSQTQGGWGTDNCNGNNTACLRDAHFGALFPTGLIVGDPDGPDADGSFAILLTSSAAVAKYMPAGGMPAALTADQTDPQVTSSGVFGSQLVAATLNVAFDAAGIGKCTLTGTCTFCCVPGTLGTLVYTCGVDADLIGLRVNDVIALANIAISGGGTPAGVTISDLSNALAVLNEEFVDCDTVETGCLDFPPPPALGGS